MVELIVLTVPEEISVRARQIAQTTAQPVEQVLIEHLRTLSIPLPVLAAEEQAEPDALHHLSNDALWTIAREPMVDDLQVRAHELMDRTPLELLTLRNKLNLKNWLSAETV